MVMQLVLPLNSGNTWTQRLPAEKRNLTHAVSEVERGKPVSLRAIGREPQGKPYGVRVEQRRKKRMPNL